MLTQAITTGTDIVPDLWIRAVLDLLALAGLTLGLFLPRHHRRDLLTVFWLFNSALFCVLVVIGSGRIGAGTGLGLFAVLSIVRLRSEQYRNVEIGYFFVALSLALVNGLAPGLLVPLLLDVALLIVVAVIEWDRLLPATEHIQVVLDLVLYGDELRQELQDRLGRRIVGVGVVRVDYVRLVMELDVQYATAPDVTVRPAGGPVKRTLTNLVGR